MNARARRIMRGDKGLLPGLALLAVFLLGGCGEEAPKKPAVSANLCAYLPNGLVTGPYDTEQECATARANMPGGVCRKCEEKKGN